MSCAPNAPEVREVDRAKAQLKAGLLMSLESSGARVEQVARQTLRHGRLIPVPELVARVDAVTAQDIRAFADAMLSAKPASVTVVGAGRKSAAQAIRAAAPFTRTSLQGVA
jgi:predicted Zn-dependent peptidase